MMTQIETQAVGTGCAHHQGSNGDAAGQAAAAATLVAALERALVAARRLLDVLEPVAGCHSQVAQLTPRAPAGELSQRETEVLRLLAAGRSTRQIAAALFLSPRTVQRHVANVYLKIGTHCRAEATAYALQHGLA